MSDPYVSPLKGCSLEAAARALGVQPNRVIDLLVRGELQGMADLPFNPAEGRILIRVSSIRRFIMEGGF